MSNLSQKKRSEMLDYLKHLKKIHNNDESRIALDQIESALTEKKYGLVWEKHEEDVYKNLKHNIPVFSESKSRKIIANKNDNFNFLLEGDNLHSLKLLEKTHKGKIDVIYIDPPYNTNNSLTYNDKRVSSLDAFPHSKWLSFMEARLLLAKELLAEDGIIFMSIDDNEGHQLKILSDEIFGEDNFMGSLSVIRAEGGGMAKFIIKGHDMLLIYCKDISQRFPLARPKDIRGKVIEIDGIDYWIQEDAIRKEFGAYGNLHYEEILEYKDQDFKDKIDLGLKNNEYILVPKNNGMNIIGKLRRVDEDYSKFYSVVKHLNADGVSELKRFGLEDKFDYPKPVSLVQSLIEGATFSKKDNYTILDFFAGSGTTGEAVINANIKDGKNRNFILCTNNEVSSKQKLSFVKQKGYLENYNPSKNTTDSAIENRIENELSKHELTLESLISNNKKEYESFGIAQSVTYERLRMINSGYKSKDNGEKVIFSKKLTVGNLKNVDKFLTEIEDIKNKNEYSSYKTNLKNGTLELIAKIDKGFELKAIPFNLKYYRTDFIPKITEDEDILASRLLDYIKEMVELENMCEIDDVNHMIILTEKDLQNKLKKVKKGTFLYLPSYLLLTQDTQIYLEENKVQIITIPDYYFINELREANEL
ncbi:site-specific DNA-methyltransferase [Mammaliicoccus sciuri]|uniref:DNA methylase N-4/N-6 domain-containing protein n=2 Tax=Staphylococcaceae TaxID=90964 RepID=A0A0U2NGF6_MAMSC|nr:site-specific DNA-methyltransferase [Mammaliicoccus sciuri]ALI92797.1 Hypothetical protein [Mammaliicoccus sciuri]AQW34626.1 hypothetical protein [Mammaliicoccus sciuri]AQW34680.1 hypothetical protein [Mammaliicoccus sciuri]